MTYNFDPDKWYENELALLYSKFISEEFTQGDYDKAVEDLDRKHEKMWERLDGSYRISSEK